MSSSSTSAPPQPTTDISKAYKTLTSLLWPRAPTVLEIEILPSSISPTILQSDHCIGIPKRLLTSCFLHARSRFRAHTNGQLEKPALDATLVLLLFDAGYASAVNFRKRWLLEFRDTVISDLEDLNDDKDEEGIAWSIGNIDGAVTREMMWIESLVTSPLYKHAKSSTLWAHRLWVTKTFYAGETIVRDEDERAEMARFVAMELEIVMRAGERHTANYHAWNYARDVVRIVMSGSEVEGTKEAWRTWVERVYKWCLGHPRDISGWNFLVFLMDQAEHEEGMVTDVFRKTAGFVEKLEWKGKSVEWFLSSAKQFRTGPSG